MMNSSRPLLVLFCCLFTVLCGAQTHHYDLYILAGQSNMAGRGPVTAEFRQEGNGHVLMLTKDLQWVKATHPLHFDKPRVAGVGPGLAFGIAMQQGTDTIGLIPCAVGGSPIEHWVPGAFDAATNTHPYDDAVARIQAAMKDGTVKGIIWHQGESDSSPEKFPLWLGRLKELIERFRTLVGNPDLPFVAGELGRYRPVYAGINSEVAKLPATVPHTGIVSSEGLVHRGDTTHFDSRSAQILGQRYAEKMKELQRVKN